MIDKVKYFDALLLYNPIFKDRNAPDARSSRLTVCLSSSLSLRSCVVKVGLQQLCCQTARRRCHRLHMIYPILWIVVKDVLNFTIQNLNQNCKIDINRQDRYSNKMSGLNCIGIHSLASKGRVKNVPVELTERRIMHEKRNLKTTQFFFGLMEKALERTIVEHATSFGIARL